MEKILNKKLIYYIAEIGVNHNGDINQAKKLIIEAKKAGADAVKFQSFKTEEFLSNNKQKIICNKKKINLFKMFKKLEFKNEWYLELNNFSKKNKIDFFTSVADINSAKLYLALNKKILKIASEDIINYPLLEFLGQLKDKIFILSTGMANEKEISAAIKILKKNNILILMHCVSLYPTNIEEINLNRILALRKKFKLEIGFSDHTTNEKALLIARGLGCRIYEKHFTINKKAFGPDHFLSLNSKETKDIIYYLKNFNIFLNKGNISPENREKIISKKTRRCIVADKIIKKGDIITNDKIWLRRASNGLHPKYIYKVIGSKAKKNFKINEKIII
jgi:N,N'-diacetyllegionaminate synthase